MTIDTSVPGQCTASDVQLSVQGPAACPADSKIGEDTVEGIFLMPFAHDYTFDHYVHHIDILNNAGEQIILVESEGWTVQRGKYQPDGSLQFDTTTCFPTPPAGGCPDDYLIQLSTDSTTPLYTNSKGAFATTPPTCPVEGFWETTVRFWWSDGTTDTVSPRQPCSSA